MKLTHIVKQTMFLKRRDHQILTNNLKKYSFSPSIITHTIKTHLTQLKHFIAEITNSNTWGKRNCK